MDNLIKPVNPYDRCFMKKYKDNRSCSNLGPMPSKRRNKKDKRNDMFKIELDKELEFIELRKERKIAQTRKQFQRTDR